MVQRHRPTGWYRGTEVQDGTEAQKYRGTDLQRYRVQMSSHSTQGACSLQIQLQALCKSNYMCCATEIACAVQGKMHVLCQGNCMCSAREIACKPKPEPKHEHKLKSSLATREPTAPPGEVSTGWSWTLGGLEVLRLVTLPCIQYRLCC